MTLYYNVWLCVTLDDTLFHCMTMFDSGRLYWTLYDSARPSMSLYHPLWLWMILNDSFGISFLNIDCVWLCFHFFLIVSFLSTVWTCLKYQPSGAGGTRSPPATPHRLQCRTACQLAPKWPKGSGKMLSPRFLGAPVNFCQISVLIQALLL